MRKLIALFIVFGVALAAHAALSAQTRTPKTHRLEATPATVAYGYYWSEAKPVLRIASGDIIDVDTLLTNSPTGLARAGVPRRQNSGVAQGNRRPRSPAIAAGPAAIS